LKAPALTTTDERITPFWRSILVCSLLIFVGINLRSVILGVPPVLPLIKGTLGLSYTETGLLTALPTLIMGGFAWFSGLLVERIGGRAAVTIGLALLAFGALMRAIWPGAFFLYFFTIVLSLGIALAQTTAPVLVRRWFPAHIGLVSALYTDGLIIGETIGAGVTVPIMLLFLGKNAYALSFVFWGLIVIVALALWLWLAPHAPPTRGTRVPAAPPEQMAILDASKAASSPAQEKPVSFIMPGLLLGAGSLMYFAMNAWIATYNQAIHAASYTPLALTTLNALQLPASLGVTFFAQRLVGRRWPFIAGGVVALIAVIGWVATPPGAEFLWAALLGASSALVFTLGLALPPLLAAPEQVARLTGMTLTLSYSMAFVGPFIGGGLWDLFGLPPLAFLPVALAAALLIGLGSFLPLHSVGPRRS